MDLTREQEKWLFDLAGELDCPFPVEVFGLTEVEALLLDSPDIREYHVGDGMDRLRDLFAQMSNLNGLTNLRNLASDPMAITPADVSRALVDLHSNLTAADPHFDYDHEVTREHPVLTSVPKRIATVVGRESPDDPYITWHVSTKYDTALEDRSIPGGYTVYPDRMTPEQRVAWERWHMYGTPVELHGDVVGDVHVDLPGGLGGSLPEGDQVLPESALPSAISRANRPARHCGSSRTRRGRRSQSGSSRSGSRAAGSEAENTATVSTPTDTSPPTSTRDPAMSPTVLCRFSSTSTPSVGSAHRCNASALPYASQRPGRKATCFAPKTSLNISTEAFPLRGESPIPMAVVEAVDDVIRISTATRRPIGLPANIIALTQQRGETLRLIADTVSGLEPLVGIAELVVFHEDHQAAVEDLAAHAENGTLVVPWEIPFDLIGTDFVFTFGLEVIGPIGLEPAEPSPTAAERGLSAVRLTSTETTRGRLRWTPNQMVTNG